MTEQKYRAVVRTADGRQMYGTLTDINSTPDEVTATFTQEGIERPVTTAETLHEDEWDGNWRTISQDEQTARRKLATWTKADLIDRHIGDWQRDLQFRESAQEQLDEWVARARAAESQHPSPHPPTREQIAEVQAAILRQVADEWAADPAAWGDNDRDYRNELRDRADALIQNGADR